MQEKINVAIDGPAGAGKSTVARELASRLGYVYIDTGAMYRALTWKALESGAGCEDEASLADILQEMELELRNNNGTPEIIVDGRNVTDEIRLPEVTNNVSYTARHPHIRKYMVHKQQELAARGGTVMDGRDIGTAVLPEAEMKFFLNATVEERAARRHEEQLGKGMDSDLELLKSEISRRDMLDSERETAPLRKADDAEEVDTTRMSIKEVVDYLYTRIQRKLAAYE
ncbi:(d)CMP kinase [Alkalicoccus saliphilus]|jgi:CMP/dCMP kinase|uniref:Cytidylate kinase n=1 Tax=Alkalicoccus saliphilus TaxID=200989 RepID=A0A2T4UAG5_9BACI|nr:(d)CMP kinase [Alkalicoccus saliphilus]PTL40383.1 (d)CMP kinase [Alkalicoccus saliphilus]